MKYKTSGYIAHEALTLNATLELAKLAGWQLERRPELLPPSFRSCFYVPAAELVLIPSAGEIIHSSIEAGLSRVKCEAVLVGVGIDQRHQPTAYISVARWERGNTHWHRALRLWESDKHEYWLIPDPHGDEPNDACFRLDHGRLRAVDYTRWNSSTDLDAGIRRGGARMRCLGPGSGQPTTTG